RRNRPDGELVGLPGRERQDEDLAVADVGKAVARQRDGGRRGAVGRDHGGCAAIDRRHLQRALAVDEVHRRGVGRPLRRQPRRACKGRDVVLRQGGRRGRAGGGRRRRRGRRLGGGGGGLRGRGWLAGRGLGGRADGHLVLRVWRKVAA